jgi:hypothetical protein
MTPEELAEQLKIEVADVLSLIEEGKLRAIRIGTWPFHGLPSEVAFPDGTRWCLTRTGRAKFRVPFYRVRCRHLGECNIQSSSPSTSWLQCCDDSMTRKFLSAANSMIPGAEA